MNALNKTNNVRRALECCRGPFQCDKCPYSDSIDCRVSLYSDALEVIDGFKAELKKRTTKSSAAGPIFITLTIHGTGKKIAVKLDDISYICERKDGDGSSIYLKALDGARVFVAETIIDILEKVSQTFIALTIYGSGEKIAVKLDDISYICERGDGTWGSVYLKVLDGVRVSVAESFVDILEKISNEERE